MQLHIIKLINSIFYPESELISYAKQNFNESFLHLKPLLDFNLLSLRFFFTKNLYSTGKHVLNFVPPPKLVLVNSSISGKSITRNPLVGKVILSSNK